MQVEPTGYVPFVNAYGTLTFSPNADPEQMRSWGRDMANSGVPCALHLVRDFDFIRDGNRIKSPLSKAERWQLALRQFEAAVASAARSGNPHWINVTKRGLESYRPDYVAAMVRSINDFHAAQLGKLRATKSGKQQLKVSRATIELTRRLDFGSVPAPVVAALVEIREFWKTQELISSQYDNA